MSKITPPLIFRNQMVINADQTRKMLEEIENSDTMITTEEIQDKLRFPTKQKLTAMVCGCCGAPMKGDVCEYCGTMHKMI